MRYLNRLLACAAIALLALIPVTAASQNPPPAGQQGQAGGPGRQGRTAGAGGAPGRGGNSFPQQQRPLADPATPAPGKGLYRTACSASPGLEPRRGPQSGPNHLP